MNYTKNRMSQDKLNAIKRFYEAEQIDSRDIMVLIEHAEATIQYDGKMTFEQLQNEVGEWSRYNFPNNKDHHPLMGMVEELGELHHARLKYEQNIRGYDYGAAFDAQEDALADILIYMADYCARNGIQLQKCVEKVWPQVRARDWRKYPKNGISE